MALCAISRDGNRSISPLLHWRAGRKYRVSPGVALARAGVEAFSPWPFRARSRCRRRRFATPVAGNASASQRWRAMTNNRRATTARQRVGQTAWDSTHTHAREISPTKRSVDASSFFSSLALVFLHIHRPAVSARLAGWLRPLCFLSHHPISTSYNCVYVCLSAPCDRV